MPTKKKSEKPVDIVAKIVGDYKSSWDYCAHHGTNNGKTGTNCTILSA